MEDTSDRPVIVLRRSDGLGARLLAFLRTWRYARRVGADLHVHWPSLAYSFRDAQATDWGIADLIAFPPDAHEVRFLEGPLPPPVAGRRVVEADPDLARQLRFGIDAATLFEGTRIVECGGQRALRVPGESDAEIADGIRALAERLSPSAPVRAALEPVRRHLGGQPYAVVHIRRGDVLANTIACVRDGAEPARAATLFRSYIDRCPPVAVLAEAVDRASPNARVLCLTDTPAYGEDLRRRIGDDRCLSGAGWGHGLGPIQRAWFEILLARDAAIIHAGSSAFVRLAAEMGRASLRLAHPIAEAHWLHAFETEVLDAADVAPRDRPAWRAIHAAELSARRDYHERSRQAAARQARQVDARVDPATR